VHVELPLVTVDELAEGLLVRGNGAPSVPGMPSLPRIVRRLLGGAGHRIERLASSSLEGQEA